MVSRAANSLIAIRGIDGKGISNASYNGSTGVLTLNFTDGSTYSTGDLRGATGSAGKGISSTSYDALTGVVTITYTDSTTFQTGDLRGVSSIVSGMVTNVTGLLKGNGSTISTAVEGVDYIKGYTETDTLASVTSRGYSTRASSGVFAHADRDNPGIEVIGGGGDEPAFMTFHRPGVYAIKLGLDGSELKVGGWSMGAVAYKLWHEGNLNPITTSNIGSQSVNYATSAYKLTGSAHTLGTDGWFRSDGNCGWYNETYSVGIYSYRAGWVDTYNGAAFNSASGIYDAGNRVYSASSRPTTLEGYGITDWRYGNYGALDTMSTTSGCYYFTGNSPIPGQSDGTVWHHAYPYAPGVWGSQLVQNYRDGRLYARGRNDGGWSGWLTIIDSGTIGSQSVSYASLAGRATRANGNFYVDDNYGCSVVGNYDSFKLQGVFAMGEAYKLPADGSSGGTLYGLAWSHPNAGGQAANLTNHGLILMLSGAAQTWISDSIKTVGRVTGSEFYGAGTGLTGTASSLSVGYASNSGTVGGLSVSTDRNNVANKIVRTDGNGYLQVGYINSNYGNENNNLNPDRVWGTNGSDDYLRTYRTSALSVNYATSAGTVSNFTSDSSRITSFDFNSSRQNGIYTFDQAGINGPGCTYGGLINIRNLTDTGLQIAGGYVSDNLYFRGGANFSEGNSFTSWRTIWHDGNLTPSSFCVHRGEGANYIDYSRYVYNNGAYSGSGWIEPSDLGVRYALTSTTADKLRIIDRRSTNPTPNEWPEYSISTFFLDGYGQGWDSGITVRGWGADYCAWQLRGCATSSTTDKWYLRSGISSTWNTWREIIHSGNIAAQSVDFAAHLNNNGPYAGDDSDYKIAWWSNGQSMYSTNSLYFKPASGFLYANAFYGAGTGLTGVASSLSVGWATNAGSAPTSDGAVTYSKVATSLKNKNAVSSTIDLSAGGIGTITLTANTAFTFTGFELNKTYLLIITANGYTASWAAGSKHVGLDGSASFATTGVYYVSLTCIDSTSGSEKLLTIIMKGV